MIRTVNAFRLHPLQEVVALAGQLPNLRLLIIRWSGKPEQKAA